MISHGLFFVMLEPPSSLKNEFIFIALCVWMETIDWSVPCYPHARPPLFCHLSLEGKHALTAWFCWLFQVPTKLSHLLFISELMNVLMYFWREPIPVTLGKNEKQDWTLLSLTINDSKWVLTSSTSSTSIGTILFSIVFTGGLGTQTSKTLRVTRACRCVSYIRTLTGFQSLRVGEKGGIPPIPSFYHVVP